MPTQRGGYYLDGKKIPSVTTILKNLGWSADSLMGWAAKVGPDYLKIRDEAAGIGTCCHQMVDDYLNGTVFDETAFTEPTRLSAQTPFDAFKQWHADNPLTIIASERPLVSSALRYAGTFDFLVKMGSEIVLIDIKTSNWIYPSHVIQISAYADLIQECMNIRVDRGLIVQIRKDGTFSTLSVDGQTITQARSAFYHLLELHKLKSPLESITKTVNRPGAIAKSSELTIMGKAVA